MDKIFYGYPFEGVKTGGFGDVYIGANGVPYKHRGLDIGGAPIGTPGYARCYGTIVHHVNDGSFGKSRCIEIDNTAPQLYALFAHGNAVYGDIGDRVEPNTHLFDVGNTGTSSGPHCHLQVCKNTLFPTDISYSYDPEPLIYTEEELVTIEGLQIQVDSLGIIVEQLTRVLCANGVPGDPLDELKRLDDTPNNLNVYLYVNQLNEVLGNHINNH